MTAAAYNIIIEQGADFLRTLTFKSSGAPIDITNWSLTGQVRDDYGGTKLADFAFVKTDPTNGVATMGLDDAVTAALTRGDFVFDVFRDDGSGDKKVLMRGRARVQPRVTA